MNEYLVHLRNDVSGWVLGTYHHIADSAEAAGDEVCAKIGMIKPEFNDAVKVIVQELGPAVKQVVSEEKQQAEAVVESEPVPATPVAVLSEAEQVAVNLLKNLPPDVAAALADLTKK